MLIDNERRQSVIERVGNACQQGRQAYWVCALIEESEALDANAAEVTAEQLTEALPIYELDFFMVVFLVKRRRQLWLLLLMAT